MSGLSHWHSSYAKNTNSIAAVAEIAYSAESSSSNSEGLSNLSKISDSTTTEYNICHIWTSEERMSGLPEEWRIAFRNLDFIMRPQTISKKSWPQIIDNIGIILDKHIHDIIKHGWTIADIFGVHRVVPEKRYDCMGLLMLLGDSKVTGVTKDRIAITTPTGTEQGFYKKAISSPIEQIMIWELHEQYE